MSGAVVTERLTIVSCRGWPIVGCGRQIDDSVVVVVDNRVIAASAVAEQLGVRVGMRRREAQRLVPEVEVLAPDPIGEVRRFEPVLRALEDLTPRIEIDEPGRCSFLTRGPSRYFGGDLEMSRRVVAAVVEALDGVTSVHVGTADGQFAAARAASVAEPNDVRVIPPGASAAFLGPLPVGLLAADVTSGPLRTSLDDLIGVLVRLGLPTLGAFGELSDSDVLARFGATGAQAHRWARGLDYRLWAPTDPCDDLEVAIELDPPVERVDQAAFVARALAEDFMQVLRGRGVSCARVEVAAETEHGETQHRLWRSEEAFSAAAISDRMRWQLDGWLSGPVKQRPTGGLVRLALRPDDLSVAAGRQLGFWGEQTALGERAARAVARVQGLAGDGAARVPELRGGRSPGDEIIAIPAESVDLVERSAAVDRTLLGASSGSAIAGIAGVGKSRKSGEGSDVGRAWLGRLPAPRPCIVHDPPLEVGLVDGGGHLVEVTGRGVMPNPPAVLVATGARARRAKAVPVVGWSGPWLLDERWWQADQHRRSVRMQVVLEDGRALVVGLHSGRWFVEASYD